MNSGPEHRRTGRFRFAERVRINVTREGILVDLSPGGALLLLSRAYEFDDRISLRIETTEQVHVAARVVRCTPGSIETGSATLARKEYYVAVEFLDVGPDIAAAIRRIMESHQGR